MAQDKRRQDTTVCIKFLGITGKRRICQFISGNGGKSRPAMSAFADGCGLFGFQGTFVPFPSVIQWVLQGIVLS